MATNYVQHLLTRRGPRGSRTSTHDYGFRFVGLAAGTPPPIMNTYDWLTEIARDIPNHATSRNYGMDFIISSTTSADRNLSSSLGRRALTDLLDDVPRVQLAADVDALIASISSSNEDFELNENTVITIGLTPNNTGGCAGELEETQKIAFFYPHTQDWCLMECLYYFFFVNYLWRESKSCTRANAPLMPHHQYTEKFSAVQKAKRVKQFFADLCHLNGGAGSNPAFTDHRDPELVVPMFQAYVGLWAVDHAYYPELAFDGGLSVFVHSEPDALGERDVRRFEDSCIIPNFHKRKTVDIYTCGDHFIAVRDAAFVTIGVKRKDDGGIGTELLPSRMMKRMQVAFDSRCPACNMGGGEATEECCLGCGLSYCGAEDCEDRHEERCGRKLCKACLRFFDTTEELLFHSGCLRVECPRCHGMFPAAIMSKSRKKGKRMGTAAMSKRATGKGVKCPTQVAPHDCIMTGKKFREFPRGLMAYDLETSSRSGKLAEVRCLSIWYTRDNEAAWREIDARKGERGAADLGEEERTELLDRLTGEGWRVETFITEEEIKSFFTRALIDGEWRGLTMAAHNGGRFDAPIVLGFILKHFGNDVIEEIAMIREGAMYKQLKYPKTADTEEYTDERGEVKKRKLPARLNMIDSFFHMPMPLKKIGKAFGLEVSKGEFPLKCLNLEDWGTKVYPTIPGREMFAQPPDAEWYSEEVAKGEAFDVKREMVKYCEQDVIVLGGAMAATRRETCGLFLKQYDSFFDPWSYITGASWAFDALNLFGIMADERGAPATPHRSANRYVYRWGVKLALLKHKLNPHHAWEGCMIDGEPVRLGKGIEMCALDKTAGIAYRVLSCAHTGCDKCYLGQKGNLAPCSEDEGEDTDVEEAEGGIEVGKEMTDRSVSASAAVDCRTSQENVGYFSLEEAKVMEERKKKYLESQGYRVEDVQQCDVVRMWNFDRAASAAAGTEKLRIPETYSRLSVPEAYMGGYVASSALYYRCSEEEIGEWGDFTSLYPAMMTKEYPMGVGEHMDFSTRAMEMKPHLRGIHDACMAENRLGDRIRGFARVTLLVNRERLQHPLVYAYRKNGAYNAKKHADENGLMTKLVASACRTCGAREPLTQCEHSEMQFCSRCEGVKEKCLHIQCCSTCQVAHMGKECDHSEKQRQFTATWTTVEIDTELEFGGTLVELHEGLHYKEWGNPMRDFVLDIYVKKELASPWEKGVDTDEQKAESWEETQRSCEEIFGRRMPYEWQDRKEDAALRQIAKISLNSCYGKLGEKVVKTQHTMSADVEQIRKLTAREKYGVSLDFILRGADPEVDDGVCFFSHKSRDTNARVEAATSKAWAAYVCGYGRVALFRQQMTYGGRALYCDTDSVAYVAKRDATQPKVVSFLGSFAREPEKNMTAFASLGPKVYAFTPDDGGRDVVKGKGITAAGRSGWSVDIFKKVLVGDSSSLTARQTQFTGVSCAEGLGVKISDDFHRTVRLTAAKRQILPPRYDAEGNLKCILTVPFGYKGPDPYQDIAALHAP